MPHSRRSFGRGLIGITHLRFALLVGLPITLSLIGCASGMRRQVVNPAGIAPLVPAYSVAIRHGDLVFVSGMTGIKPGTQDIIDGGVAVQTRQTLENIRTTLQTAGATMADVGECTVFLLDMADYAAMNTVYVQFFPVDPPARATLAVSAAKRRSRPRTIRVSLASRPDEIENHGR
jgi:2-iminobutanoate/2-iminopropanoate deaminase